MRRTAEWAQQDRETRQQIADLRNQPYSSDPPVTEPVSDHRDIEIARLAGLPPRQFYAERDTASAALGLNKTQLDVCVKAARNVQKQRKRDLSVFAERRKLDIGSDEEIANRVIADMLAGGAMCIHSEGAFYAYTGRVWEVLGEAEFQREFISPMTVLGMARTGS
jgi:hypothetical protein